MEIQVGRRRRSEQYISKWTMMKQFIHNSLSNHKHKKAINTNRVHNQVKEKKLRKEIVERDTRLQTHKHAARNYDYGIKY